MFLGTLIKFQGSETPIDKDTIEIEKQIKEFRSNQKEISTW